MSTTSAHINRWWSFIEMTGTCWEWTGQLNQYGYGNFRWPDGSLAHRFGYKHYVGLLDSHLQIDHLCRNRKCVNPKHMEQVTLQVNVERGEAGRFNRDKTHCKRGHEFTPDNIYTHKGYGRRCRKCRLMWSCMNGKGP